MALFAQGNWCHHMSFYGCWFVVFFYPGAVVASVFLALVLFFSAILSILVKTVSIGLYLSILTSIFLLDVIDDPFTKRIWGVSRQLPQRATREPQIVLFLTHVYDTKMYFKKLFDKRFRRIFSSAFNDVGSFSEIFHFYLQKI